MTTRAIVKLGEIAEFVRGINFKPTDIVPVGTPNSVVCMRTRNVQRDLDCSDLWALDERFVTRRNQFLQKGDILVSSANSWNLVGKCCWIPELPWRATFGGFVSVLRPQNGKVDPRFLFHWLSSPRIQATMRSFGQQTTNISNLNTERCLQLAFALPSLAEQQRIANILDRAEALRAKRRAALAQLDTLTQSIFLDLFGDPIANPKNWPIAEIGGVCDLVVDCVNRTAPIVEGPTPFKMIRTTNVRGGRIDTRDVRYVTEQIFHRWNRRATPQPGDVLLTREAPVGEAGMLTTADNVFLGQRLMLYRANPKLITPEYLLFSFRSKFLQRQFAANGSGSTVKHLPLPVCKSFRVLLPPVQLQSEFRSRLHAVETLRCRNMNSMSEMGLLFDSIQQRAFQGML